MKQLELRINGLSGELCTITKAADCTVAEVKAIIEVSTGIPKREQRLCASDHELADRASLWSVVDAMDCKEALMQDECSASLSQTHSADMLNLTLVRRSPEQAAWLEQVTLDGRRLQDAPVHIREDREVVLAACKQRGWTLRYAVDELKADRDIVWNAIQISGHALGDATPELRSDPELVLMAVQRHAEAFRFAADHLRNDRNFVLLAVRHGGQALEYAPPFLKADREIAHAAVSNDSRAIVHVAEHLQMSPRLARMAHEHAWNSLSASHC